MQTRILIWLNRKPYTNEKLHLGKFGCSGLDISLAEDGRLLASDGTSVLLGVRPRGVTNKYDFPGRLEARIEDTDDDQVEYVNVCLMRHGESEDIRSECRARLRRLLETLSKDLDFETTKVIVAHHGFDIDPDDIPPANIRARRFANINDFEDIGDVDDMQSRQLLRCAALQHFLEGFAEHSSIRESYNSLWQSFRVPDMIL